MLKTVQAHLGDVLLVSPRAQALHDDHEDAAKDKRHGHGAWAEEMRLDGLAKEEAHGRCRNKAEGERNEETPRRFATGEEPSRALAQELVAEIKADGAYALPKPSKGKGKKPKAKPGDKPVASDGTPLWKKKEFWYIAGGAAGVVLLSTFIGIGVGVTQQNERKQRAIDTAILGGL